MPPVDRRCAAALGHGVGARRRAAVARPFAGVIIVEARKELMAPIGKPAKARALRDFVTIGGRAS